MSARTAHPAADRTTTAWRDRAERVLAPLLYRYASPGHALGSGAQPRWVPPSELYGPRWVLPYLPYFLGVQRHMRATVPALRALRDAGNDDRLGLGRRLYGGRLMPSPLAQRLRSDDGFARARLAGPNPMLIERIGARRARSLFPDVAAVDRLRGQHWFLVDYAALRRAREEQPAAVGKYLPCPRLLLREPADGSGALRAVAIQPEAGSVSIVTVEAPGDAADAGARWRMARLCVQVADINHQVLHEHLGHCHGVLSAFALATPRCLSRRHPLRRLLAPHLEGTVMLNWITLQSFRSPDDFFGRLYAGSLEQSRATVAASVRGCDLRTLTPEADLARRGMAALPLDYPWRDDARLWWPVLRRFVAAVVAQAYPRGAALAADAELGAWLRELADPRCGDLRGLPEPGSDDVDALTELLTLVLFLAGPQHAAMHYPQTPYYTDASLFPAALYAPLPESDVPPDWFARALPPLTAAISQFHSNHLGNHRSARFGDYRHWPLGRAPELAGARVRLRSDLAAIERTIDERNRHRSLPYPWLRPSDVPNSTNI